MGTVADQTESGLIRHARGVFREATLDLSLRRGVFWTVIRDYRHQLQLCLYREDVRDWEAAGNRCPDRYHDSFEQRCPGCLYCQPPNKVDTAPCDVPPSLVDPELPWLSPFQALAGQIGANRSSHVQWAVVQVCYRTEDRFAGVPSIARQAFLIECLRFDPPADRLQDYADWALEWCAPRRPLGGHFDVPDLRGGSFGLPIAWLPYPADLEVAVRGREREHARLELERYKTHVAAELEALGLNAASILDGADRRYRLDVPPIPRTSYDMLYESVWRNSLPHIRVDDHTTAEDVRRAFTAIRADKGKRRPKRDPLVCVQCAIWYDDLGWSQKKIAARFGWAVQYPSEQKPRSETVRQHVVVGRRMRRHENPAG